jgi:hypothetical protein
MVRKKLVLNACGVKSLGGVKLFVEAFELLVESDNEIIVLYSENEFYNDLKNQSLENKYIEFIKLSNKRVIHPFYYLVTNRKQRKIIENSDAIIHFGNFGFNTKIKSFVLVQNILPFVLRDLKNTILKYLITKSFKSSEYIIVQLEHMTEVLHKKYKDKIISIGQLVETVVETKSKSGKIVLFGSKVPNKNFNFMVKVLKQISKNNIITIINPPNNMSEFNCVYTKTQDQTMGVMSEHEIYFHASEYETVGLPIYEAQNLGLKLVIPERPYTNYFRSENVFTYELNNPQSALISIEEAKNFNIKNSPALIYNENWSKILEYI